MAKCDEGYRCAACGRHVEELSESLLYLRYVLGEVPFEELHRSMDCHIACCPETAQYIAAPPLAGTVCEGAFDKRGLDPGFVRGEEERITKAWLALGDPETRPDVPGLMELAVQFNRRLS